LDGQVDRWLEIGAEMAAQTELVHAGLYATTWALPFAGRPAEAQAIADDTRPAARSHGILFGSRGR
jgi:hypothetical protein